MRYSYVLPNGDAITVEASNEKEAVSLVHQRIDPAQIEEVLAEGIKEESKNSSQKTSQANV